MSTRVKQSIDRLSKFGFTKRYIRAKAGFASRQAYHYHFELSEHDAKNETILREKILSALLNIKKETIQILNEEIDSLRQ